MEAKVAEIMAEVQHIFKENTSGQYLPVMDLTMSQMSIEKVEDLKQKLTINKESIQMLFNKRY